MSTATKEMVTLTLPVQIPVERLRHMVEASIATDGSYYWIAHVQKNIRSNMVISDFQPGGKEFAKADAPYDPCHLIPFVSGCSLSISTQDKPDNFHVLNMTIMKKGTAILAEKYPQKFAAMMNGQWDVWDADAWLQCCLFGELKYG